MADQKKLAADVAKAWAEAAVLEKFEALAPSHQYEYLKWIDEAKRPETRRRRIEKAAEMMKP